jgi:hypothetical protein
MVCGGLAGCRLARSLSRCSTLELIQDSSLVLAFLIQQKCKCPPLPSPTSISHTHTTRSEGTYRTRGGGDLQDGCEFGRRLGVVEVSTSDLEDAFRQRDHPRPPPPAHLGIAIC